MQKLIIWVKINWLKTLLITLFALLLVGVAAYLIYITHNYQQLEPYTKKQLSGMQAMQMPMFVFAQLLTLPFLFAMYYYLSKGGGLGTFKVNALQKGDLGVTWDDIIGMEEAKKDAQEVTQFLKDHSLQSALGGNIIKGTIMIGPPGCGKTYLAKAMANECGLPMLSAVGSDFVAMFMGQGASRMKSLFKQARELARIHGGCIIFIDEIDAFARERAGKGPAGIQSTDISYNATINQFLTELDGLRKSENNVIVLGATNVPEEELDPAIMRSGRFDRKIRVEKPNAKERAQLLKYYLSKYKPEENIDIEAFADKSKWFSPSDIHNLVREAGVIALRHKHAVITSDDLKESLDRIMISIEKMGGDKILSEKVNVHWNQVIGMESAKREAWEIVELLRDRNKLKAVGGRIIKGVIMLGPPGCGKTYLAKAMATESGFPFISKAGTEFIEQFVGVGPKRVRELFKEARALARAENGCIIFIDEIDAIAKPRSFGSDNFGGPSEYNATINQLLTEMDGLRQAENNIVLLAATNAPESALDQALLRPGRFDRKITVTLPNLQERADLFKYYLSKVKCDASCDPNMAASKALYFSPAQIDSMVRESGLIALRNKRDTITFKDLSDAYDRIQYGDKSNIHMTPNEKLWTAYHESGHAIIGYLLHPTDDVIKATIIPRKGSLGMVSRRPYEELHSWTKEKLLADIKVLLAAFAAERIQFGSTTTGVGGGQGSDFDHAMRIAHTMVWSLGMGKSGLLGDFQALRNSSGNYPISEKTRERLDNDVQDILQSCFNEAEQILREKKDLLDHFSHELLNKEELEYDDIRAIFDKFNLKPLSGR